MDEIAKVVRLVICTLNQLDVRGRDNLDKLLGCIQELEKLAAGMSKDASGQEADKGAKA